MANKVQKILSKIATRKLCTMDEHMAFYNDKAEEDYRFLSEIEELINTLQKEPVSEDLDKAAENWIDDDNNTRGADYIGVTVAEDAFKAGARWQKQQMMKEVIEAECFGFQWEQALFSFKLPSNKYHVGSKKKIILIKED